MMINSQKFSFCNWQTFTIKLIILICLLPITQQALAQFTDDFSDGEFSSDPSWSGDELLFTGSSNQLRLQGPAVSGTSFLTTPSNAINEAVWEFFVKMDFNPSGSNYARVYLSSSSGNLSGNPDGYFVQIGSSDDDVCLYRQSGSMVTKIIDGENARLNLASVEVTIKVTRDGIGNWELFSGIGNSSLSEGIVFDDTHTSSSFFGVHCVYTSTRSDDFYFDNFSVTGEPFRDITSPELLSLSVKSSREIELEFSEAIEEKSSTTTANYKVSVLGYPEKAIRADDERKVMLTFRSDFPNGKACDLEISNILDLEGNTLVTTKKTFLFIEAVDPVANDVIISEIFADPSPVVGLPENEFVEIYNRSTHPFNLLGWSFTDGSSKAYFPEQILLPGEYAILTNTDAAIPFSTYGKTVSLPGFPSLNNSSDALTLKDPKGINVDSVRYADTWYLDSEKKSGGWSLELIDPENICSESDNWIASENESGGTPGKQNSVFAYKPDLSGPILLTAIPQSPGLLTLTFNEKLEKTLPAVDQLVINPSVEVRSMMFKDQSLTTLQVSLASDLKSGVTYAIHFGRIYDCAGNAMLSNQNEIEFGLPEPAVQGDIVINEILFNPRPTGVDFVELQNASTKFINLKGWSLSNIENDLPVNVREISAYDLVLKPGEFIALTQDRNVLKGEYNQAPENRFYQTPSVPSMSDDAGSIAILDSNQSVLDEFQYADDYHSPFVKDDEGVSLERVSASARTQDSENWKSASSTAGFATPGYLNSNARTHTITEDAVKIEPEVFDPATSPDFVMIHYKFDQPGLIANIKVVDAEGHTIKEVANNELLGTAGFFRWDGDTSSGYQARIGYYLVWISVVDASGRADVFRKRVAVSGKF